MNYCIFRMEKLKSSSDVCNILKEQHRSEDYESERADPERSHLNSYSDNFENSFEKFKNLLPKKRRKNAVVALRPLNSSGRISVKLSGGQFTEMKQVLTCRP